MKRNIIALNRDDKENTQQVKFEFGKERTLADDALLENSLVLLYSEMDQHLVSLSNKAQKQPYTAITILLRMINECAEFTQEVLEIEPEEEFLSNLTSIASDDYAHLRLLHVRQNRISDTTALNLYNGWTGEQAERHLVFKEISSGMEQILKSYLSFFSSNFSIPETSDQWDDVCEAFTYELSKSLKSVSF